MTILFLPDFGSSNPYQKLLAQALSRRNIQVEWNHGRRKPPMLRSFSNKGRPDIIHLHWLHPFIIGKNKLRTFVKTIFFFFELAVIRTLNIRIVWTVHNLYSHKRGASRIERWTTRNFIRFCDRIIVHGPHAREECRKIFGAAKKKIVVAPHGNFIGAYPDSMKRDKARKVLNLDNDQMAFLLFGQLRENKGIKALLDAFKKKSDGSAVLIIAGRPMDKNTNPRLFHEIEKDKRIRANLTFIPDENIQIYMKAADVVVLPYDNILTSGSAVLAMSFGKPVIAADIPYLREVVDRKGGVFYSSTDPDGLNNALEKMSSMDLKRMGEYNRHKMEKHSWDDVAQIMSRVYFGEDEGESF